MSHNVETMAYANEVPWHGLGVKVSDTISPDELLVVAGLNWKAKMVPTYYKSADGKYHNMGKFASVRDTDGQILTPCVSKNWEPVQNSEALRFFTEFCARGDMKMETAGSLQKGKYVWALAKVAKDFALFGGKDKIEGYLLFCSPHVSGKAITIQFTPIRVVCNNTLDLSLNENTGEHRVRRLHNGEFDADEVKTILGLSSEAMDSYQEQATFLANHRMTADQVDEYFKTLYPANDGTSHTVNWLKTCLEEQPGAEFGRGTWWQGFNAVTYYLDHSAGRSPDTRMASSWFGSGRVKKKEALKLALKMAA